MNEGNQLSVYRYTGELLFKIDYKPAVVEARHEDTGAGARTKTQALLFAASWRPMPEDAGYVDKPATPRAAGAPKRKKGLPGVTENVSDGPPVAAYRPKGGGGGTSLISQMMRGEISAPEPAARDTGGGWDLKEGPKPLEEWEVKKMQREAKKEAERKELEAKEAEKELLRNIVKEEKDSKKKLKELKRQLEGLEELKEKDWDELTEEDDAQLEGEVELRQQIAELEKKVGGG